MRYSITFSDECGQVNLVIDIVSYGIAPAILLLGYGESDPILLPLAFVRLAAAAIRLSYFSTFGLSAESQYTGMALDNNIALVVLCLFESAFLTKYCLQSYMSTPWGLLR
ncbi:hypothetical protein N9K98_02345 [Luminiphilus sp.]|nr:hypothetical protein [Luminiphilus sp.]